LIESGTFLLQSQCRSH